MSVNRMINQQKVAVSVTGPVLPDRLIEMNLYFRWLRFTNFLRYKYSCGTLQATTIRAFERAQGREAEMVLD